MSGISTVQVQVLNLRLLTQGLEVSAQGLGCSESGRPALLMTATRLLQLFACYHVAARHKHISLLTVCCWHATAGAAS